MTAVTFEELPGGITVAFGGTRILVRRDRPWQTDIHIDPRACPFEKKDDSELATFATASGWRLLLNKYSPFPWHRLLVPGKCWSKRKIRSLGGQEEVECVLSLAQRIIGSVSDEFWLGVHVGATAGQNVGHLHYHLLKPLRRSNNVSNHAVEEYCRSRRTSVFRRNSLQVVLGGVRAGQCFVVPVRANQSTISPAKFARVLCEVIELYNEKFRSIQGLPPDYMLAFRFLGQNIRYASYVPILNNWGFTEYLGILERTPLILPWPPELTAIQLKTRRHERV